MEEVGAATCTAGRCHASERAASVHTTTTTGTAGDAIDLPPTTAIIFELPTNPVFDLDVVAAGKRDGRVVGADAASTRVLRGERGTLAISLRPISPCTEGALYCGGTSDILAESETLYRCTGGLPSFYARCSSGCIPHYAENGECFASGLCRDGGGYCGGHVLGGDPYVLYVCQSLDPTNPMRCPDGCLVRGDGDDTCK